MKDCDTITDYVAQKLLADAVRTMTPDEYAACVALESERAGLYQRHAPDVLEELRLAGADPRRAAHVMAHFDPDETLSRACAPPPVVIGQGAGRTCWPCEDCAMDDDPPVLFDAPVMDLPAVIYGLILGAIMLVSLVLAMIGVM